ncbi:MAG: TRAP transporter TatT component family protein [Syntrophales bacterium]|nr:TRAP transporter TatT component family protein [Syntrophales bacterium]
MVTKARWFLQRFGLLLLFISLGGCSQKAYMVRSMAPLMDDMTTTVNMNSDVDLMRDGLPAGLIQIDGFIKSDPNNKILLMGAESYFGYAFSFVEDVNKPRASALYLKAREYALRVLRKKLQFDEEANDLNEVLSKCTREDVPALYWAAGSWMSWIGLNVGSPEALMDLPKVEAMLQRVIELDETYYYGTAHAMLGSFYSAQPKNMGGDPEKAYKHFQKAFKISGSKLLFVQLMYAKFYTVQIQDKSLFVKTLNEIVAAPVNFFPEKNLANEVAKRKAKDLLEKADTLF